MFLTNFNQRIDDPGVITMVTKAKTNVKEEVLVIKAPNFQTSKFHIVGTAPFVQHNFSQKARAEMLANQTATKGTTKKKKEPRDLDADYEGAFHHPTKGGYGIPAPAFRSACISACRVAGFQMTKAKLSVFVEPDDFDQESGMPLVYLKGEPVRHEAAVRLESGVASIAIRPMWHKWSCDLRVTYDGDQFNATDVANLLARAGLQVGVGEGRPDSKKSNGMGWGTFRIDQQ